MVQFHFNKYEIFNIIHKMDYEVSCCFIILTKWHTFGYYVWKIANQSGVKNGE